MTIPIGRKGRLYLVKEDDYGFEQCLASGNACRRIESQFGFNPHNRVTSPEKKRSPGPVNRFDRKKTAELSTFVALLRPSGTLNTLPEIDPILEAAFGDVTNVTLATTVEVSPTPTSTTATVASAGTLAAGDAVLIWITGQDDSPFVRILTDVTGAALTWAPALRVAPSAGDDIKGGITYKLTTDLAISLCMAHYIPPNYKRELLGVGINELALAFDANEEVRVTASGPAKEQRRSTVQDEPAEFTVAGDNPPSGLIGEILADGAAFKIKSSEITISNGLIVRNQEYGVNGGTEIYRQGRREIKFGMETFAEDEDAVYALAEAGTNVSLLKQTGHTEGNIVAVYAPIVEFMVPETDDPEEEVSWSFEGLALESADDENDELTLAVM